MTEPTDASSPDRWTPVRAALASFRTFVTDRVPPLDVEHVNDRMWTGDEEVKYREMRKTGVYGCVGVYLHFAADGKLLYVGSTLDSFDRFWGSRPPETRFTDVIRIPGESSFLALSLERFLQDQLGIPPRQYR